MTSRSGLCVKTPSQDPGGNVSLKGSELVCSILLSSELLSVDQINSIH